MMFSVSVKHKKDKKIFLHIDLTYSYEGSKTYMHILAVVLQSSMQLQLLLSWHAQLNLNTIEIYNHLSNICLLTSNVIINAVNSVLSHFLGMQKNLKHEDKIKTTEKIQNAKKA